MTMKKRDAHTQHTRKRVLGGIAAAVAVLAVSLALVLPAAGGIAQNGAQPAAATTQTATSQLASQSYDVVDEATANDATNAQANDSSTAPSSPANQDTEQPSTAFDSSIDDPNAFGGAPYESSVVVVSLKEGLDPDEAVAQLARETNMDGLSVTSTSNEYVELALPAGLSVEDALDAFAQSDVIASAQPNFRYFPMGTTTADDALAQAAASVTAQAADSTTSLQAANLVAQSVSLNDTYADKLWGLSSMRAFDAWNTVRGDAPKSGQSRVTVAIIDDCFNVNHVDLKNNIAVSYNAVTGMTNSGMSGMSDHGTHVAGIIAAQANNKAGVAGVSYNARIMPIRTLSSLGEISSYTLIKAYDFVIANAKAYNVRVINMSLGAPLVTESGALADKWDTTSDDALLNKIDEAWSKGIVTVTAAGNADDYDLDGSGWSESYVRAPFLCWPGDYDRCVNVMALQKTSSGVTRTASSNYNMAGMYTKDIAAPGHSIFSTLAETNTMYGSMSGTSMAAPSVSGVLALVFTANPTFTAAQAVSRLYSTATDLGATGWDAQYGYGEVNAYRAVASTTQPSANKTVYTAVSKGVKSSITSAKLAAKSYAYTGKLIKPAVTVYCGKAKLKNGTDYTVTYKNNKLVSTAKTKATVTITGKGSYRGTKTLSFTIVRAKNTLTVKAKTPTVKRANVAKSRYKIARSKAMTITKANGTVTYAKASGSKYLSIAKKTGIITVKKGTPRGTYSIKVTVSAAGNKYHVAGKKSVIVKVTVK